MIRGITAGAMDLLHAGHLTFLASCAKRCDELTVLLHVNPKVDRDTKNKPIESVYERYERLYACRYVDRIIPYETEEDLLNYLVTHDIQKRFLGSEYENLPYTGKGLPIEVVFIPREHNYSSTNLRKRIENSIIN